MTKLIKNYFIPCVVAIIVLRFISALYLPDVFSDEEIILMQIDSILKTGHSLEKLDIFPLFVEVGGGLSTYAFIYPIALFASIFGTQPQIIRLFIQFIYILSCWLLCLASKNFSKGDSVYKYLFIIALSLPVSLVQQNRIWDPSFVSFYFSLFLYTLSLYFSKRSYVYISISMITLVLLATVYPPCRIPAVALWVISMFSVKDSLNLKAILIVIVLCTLAAFPLAYNMLFVSGFNDRTISLMTFKGSNIMLELYNFARNFAENFNPKYLFVTGDIVPRHSMPVFGTLGFISAFPLYQQLIKKKTNFEYLMWYTIVFSCISCALTNEYQPHTLRNCLAWPAYSVLLAYGWNNFIKNKKGKYENLLFIAVTIQFAMVFVVYIMYYKGRFINFVV